MWGSIINGKKIKSPSIISKDDFVIVSSIFCKKIAKYLESNNFNFIIDSHLSWHKDPQEMHINDSDFNKIINLFTCNNSKSILKDYKNQRNSFNDNKYNFFSQSLFKQYDFPIFQYKDNEVLEAGSFNAENAIYFVKNYNYSVVCFEPNINNYINFFDNFNHKNIKFVNAALGDKNYLSSVDNNKSSSTIVDGGINIVKIITLDTYVKISGSKPKIINLDVERFELNVLAGMANFISTLPYLSVSLYHKPKDWYEIPLFIKEISKNKYNFYLGAHSDYLNELILYCSPKIN